MTQLPLTPEELEEIRKRYETRYEHVEGYPEDSCYNGAKLSFLLESDIPRLLATIEGLMSERDLWKERAYEAAGPPRDCICTEWDGQGFSVCGVICPVHYENALAKKDRS